MGEYHCDVLLLFGSVDANLANFIPQRTYRGIWHSSKLRGLSYNRKTLFWL
jgi:hypothetical protein